MRVQENREPEPKKNKLKKQSFVSLFEHCTRQTTLSHTLYEQDEKQEQEEDMNVKGIKLIVNSVNSILRMKAFVL